MPRNASNFTHIHLDFKTFSQAETPDPCLQGREGREGRGWEGVKMFVPLKEVQRERRTWGERDGSGKGGEGPAAGRILLQDPRG